MTPASETLCCLVSDSGRKTDEAARPAPTALSACSYYSGSCRKYRFCRDKHGFVATKHIFRRVKILLVATNLFCRDKLFVATTICLDKHIFVEPKLLSRHTYFCRDKHVFAATKHLFEGKYVFVATTVLLRQT